MSFVGIAVNIWTDIFGTGGPPAVSVGGLLDAQAVNVLDAQNAQIFDAQNS